jgi:hypothetical protein
MVYDPTFMGVEGIGSTQIINELENNYKSFLDWGFLSAGGFTNVSIPSTNISGFDLHKLKPTKDSTKPQNTVWQTPRKDWIYESGINYNSYSPIEISGIYVNGSFYPGPTGNSTISYTLNYPEGQVVFNNPIPPSSSVELNYSYRNIQVYKMEQFPYWREIQYRSLENKTGFNLSDKGDFSIGAEHRIQLPSVIIETVARSNSRPYRLGDKSLYIEQDILLHILSDNSKDKNNITDILRLQEDRVIWLYNTDKIIKGGIFPLKYNGSKNLTGQNYDITINDTQYQWIKCQLKNVSISDMTFTNMRMYGSIVRVTNEIIYTEFGN